MSAICAGIDIGGTNVKIGLVTGRRKLRAFASIPTQAQAGPRQVVQRCLQTVRELAGRQGIRWEALRAVGVGCPGPLNPRTGMVLNTPNLGWRDIPLRRLFQNAFRRPTALENDANLAAWGEAWAGAGRGCDHFVLLTLGTGIGGGVVLNRGLWSGVTGSAGEIGHMVLVADGEPCACGNRGCFETYASANALVKFYRRFAEKAGRRARPLPEPVTAQAICRSARRGEPLARAALDHEVRFLALGIVNTVMLLDPDKVILTGGLATAGAVLLQPLRAQVKALLERSFPFSPAVVVGTLGDQAGMVGAAGWAWHRHASRLNP